jgi:hypothetical protein
MWNCQLSYYLSAAICQSFGFMFQTLWVLKIMNLNLGKKKVIHNIVDLSYSDSCPYKVRICFSMSVRLCRSKCGGGYKI